MSPAFQAYFSQPMVAAAVIVHLVTDGTYYGDQKQETISVQLFDTKDQSHDLGEHVLRHVALGTTSAQGSSGGQLRTRSSFPFPLSCFSVWHSGCPPNQEAFVYPENPRSGRYGHKGPLPKSSLQQLPLTRHL